MDEPSKKDDPAAPKAAGSAPRTETRGAEPAEGAVDAGSSKVLVDRELVEAKPFVPPPHATLASGEVRGTPPRPLEARGAVDPALGAPREPGRPTASSVAPSPAAPLAPATVSASTSNSRAGERPSPRSSEPSSRSLVAVEPPRSVAEPPSPPSTARWLGVPVWGWLGGSVTLIGLLFLLMDLHNRDRYLLICHGSSVEAEQGRTLPWPFGSEPMGGTEYRPLQLLPETECRERVYSSPEELDRALLDLLLREVQSALARPSEANLRLARAQAAQAIELARSQRSKRTEGQKLLAEVAYREARFALSRSEDDLRAALSRFREAKRLAPDRFEDIDAWVAELEEVLRSVSPSPSQLAHPRGLPPSPGPSSPTAAPPPARPPDAGAAKPTAPAPAPDAGAPGPGSGILM
jgi:hypothetical protein